MPDTAPASAAVTIGLAGPPETGGLGDVARALAAVGVNGDATCIVLAHDPNLEAPIDMARARALAGCDVVPVTVAPSAQSDLPYHGVLGRDGAIRAVLTVARERGEGTVVFIGAGLGAFPAAWIPRLLAPARRDGADYITPHYLRAPHEGAITRSIVYPLFRAMYGLRVRQPASGEFGMSGRLQRHLLDQGLWDADQAESGIDLWIATAAAAGGFRLAEAECGPRPPGARVVLPDLSVTIAQVVGALFTDLEAHAAIWQRVRGSATVPVSGDATPARLADPDLDPARLVEAFQLGYSALRDVWAWIVPPRTILQFKRLAESAFDQFRVDDDVWADVVYDFAVAFRGRAIPRDHLLRALTPLYLGWLASFLIEMRGRTAADADARIERLCAVFEARKPYLVSRWRLPDRFRV